MAARLPRPGGGEDEPVGAVRAILDDVRDKGDVAVRELTARFDGVDVDDLRVAPEECSAALQRIPAELRAALESAAGRIEAYHRTQIHTPSVFERDGIRVESREQRDQDVTPILDRRPLNPDAKARSTMMQAEDVARAIVLCATLPPRTVVEEIVMKLGKDATSSSGESSTLRRAAGPPDRSSL